MPWGNKGGWQGGDGPWGRPSGGSNPPPPANDFDEFIRRGQNKFKDFFSGGTPDNKRVIPVVLLLLVFFWLASGIYRVNTDEQGVVLRFGEFVRIDQPGLRYHFPYPFETVETPRVTAVNKIEVTGNRMVMDDRGNGNEPESLMLTMDKNVINVQFEVQWKIKDAREYLFNVRNPEQTVALVGLSAMREVIANTPIASAITEGKEKIEVDARQLTQAILDEYKTGISVEDVYLSKADAPGPVIDAFLDVLAAQQDYETARSRAEAYKNDILPRARGAAEQMKQQAEGYKQEVVAKAKGDAARFTSVYTEYKQSPDVTRKRIYMETMESILQGMPKMIVDGKGGTQGVQPYLPLPELRNKPAESNGGAS